MPRRTSNRSSVSGLSDEELNLRAEEVYGLSPEGVKALQVILGVFALEQRQHGGLGDPETYAGLARLVGDDGICRALARQVWALPGLVNFIGRIAQAAVSEDAARARFVVGVGAEMRGDVSAAEDLYRSALEADATFELALVDLARREMVRGLYAEALDHLRTARVPADDFERAWLESVVLPAFPRTGRNEPCPCGSGRKYKLCHFGRSGQIVAVEPQRALRHKLDAWMSRPDIARIFSDAYEEISQADTGRRSKRPAAAPTPDPALVDEVAPALLPDIVLYERGGLARFIEVEGPCLPSIEAALAQTWLGTRRTLVEVQSVRRGKGLTVRDLLAEADALIQLTDVSLSSAVAPLDLLCVRLMPDGYGSVFSSDAVAVPRTRRKEASDFIRTGDGVSFARWITTPPPPPRLANTEGEPLAMIKATYRLPDPDLAAAALGRKLTDEGDGRFVEFYQGKGREWIRGTIDIEGDVATLNTNSVKRATRLERILMRVAPGTRLIKREESGLEEMLAEARSKPLPAGARAAERDLANSPEVAAMMAQSMRDFENRWIDESVPALGGLTPRQAAADTAARRELDALLKDMEWSDRRAGPLGTNQGAMSPTRLRALLGL